MAQQQQQEIDIGNLPLERLAQLKQVFEADLQTLTNALQTLRVAKDRFNNSKNCLDQLQLSKQGDPVLVPITSTLYVPGKLGDPNKITIDIGTGFYVQKDFKGAQDYLTRKVNLVSTNLNDIQEKVNQKEREYELIVEVIQRRVAMMQAKK